MSINHAPVYSKSGGQHTHMALCLAVLAAVEHEKELKGSGDPKDTVLNVKEILNNLKENVSKHRVLDFIEKKPEYNFDNDELITTVSFRHMDIKHRSGIRGSID